MESQQLPDISEDQVRALRFELVSRLADDIAHEVKNPLNSIVINLEVLRVRLSRGDPAAALDRVAVIEQEARRLHGLVDRLLQLLRPDPDESSRFALDQLLDELVPLVEARARMARNEFQQVCPATAFVAARRDVLKFALLNLLTIVHERLGDGGGTLTLHCEQRNDHVRIIIGARAGERPVRSTDPLYDASLAAVGVQLREMGGQLEQDHDAVTAVLPLAAPH